jgi:hypothetical protein
LDGQVKLHHALYIEDAKIKHLFGTLEKVWLSEASAPSNQYSAIAERSRFDSKEKMNREKRRNRKKINFTGSSSIMLQCPTAAEQQGTAPSGPLSVRSQVDQSYTLYMTFFFSFGFFFVR